MAGNLQAAQRTATELNYSVDGQEARLNMILESINRKVIVPMVEKTAEIISNFKLGKESVLAMIEAKFSLSKLMIMFENLIMYIVTETGKQHLNVKPD